MPTDITARVQSHIEHIKKMGAHCTTEETTKQALILPLLDILGFSSYDPTKVRAEYAADFVGSKSGERVDYALFCDQRPVIFIEAKAYTEKLDNHCPQLSRYYNASPDVSFAIITNGREWRFFTDLVRSNVMDEAPFMTINFEELDLDIVSKLEHFHHDKFQPESLRAIAEENIYLTACSSAIRTMLKEVDHDFVRYVGQRAGIDKMFTVKFLDELQPIVKRSVARAISGVVATILEAPKEECSEDLHDEEDIVTDPNAPEVDPDNPRIITTSEERKMLALCQELLPDHEITGKDTESYYNVLYQNKTNRWLLRYQADKKQPSVVFGIPLTDTHKAEIKRAGLKMGTNDSILMDKPENILRLAGLLNDALMFCSDDDNFRRKTD